MGGDCKKCGARRIDSQLGLEKTPEEYVAKMVEVFRGVRRVLREDGVVFLNLGDSYFPSGQRTPGLKPKDLVGIPWRVALALQADGWYLRSDIIWAKPNPMPESVTDRPTKSHEHIFLMSKSAKYFYDAAAIAEPLASDPMSWGRHSKKDPGARAVKPRPMFGTDRGGRDGIEFGNGKTRNKRDVWTVATQPFSGAHFAVFPPALIIPCIDAGTSEKGCCPDCGAPWTRVVERKAMKIKRSNRREEMGPCGQTQSSGRMLEPPKSKTVGWKPSCDCGKDAVPCTVFDPFSGRGTTGLVATDRGRSYIGNELGPEYVEMSRQLIDEANKQQRFDLTPRS